MKQENPIWRQVPGWEKDISNIAWGDIENNNEALRKLAEFVYLLAEEVGEMRKAIITLHQYARESETTRW